MNPTKILINIRNKSEILTKIPNPTTELAINMMERSPINKEIINPKTMFITTQVMFIINAEKNGLSHLFKLIC
ncbi:MAG: hypothetical protein KAW66_11605, partial [Candidatus Lokiarchaeota archaeon]|nr:hypothetical protein [Candidatus Lokiarchaeota archaeon]